MLGEKNGSRLFHQLLQHTLEQGKQAGEDAACARSRQCKRLKFSCVFRVLWEQLAMLKYSSLRELVDHLGHGAGSQMHWSGNSFLPLCTACLHSLAKSNVQASLPLFGAPIMTAETQQQQQQEAALPWASSQQELEGDCLPPAELDLPRFVLNLQLGCRLEVKWQLEEERGAAYTKWWGAVLDSRPEGEKDGEGRQVYLLRYDSDPDTGFDENEICCVTFIEEHVLYDMGQDDELVWRRAGDSWEEPQAPEGESKMADGPEVYSLNEIAVAIEAAERRRGRTLDQDAAEALSAFPQEQQMFIAAGFRSYTDHIAVGMAQLKEQHGPDYIVTVADVAALTSAARQAAMQSRGLGGSM